MRTGYFTNQIFPLFFVIYLVFSFLAYASAIPEYSGDNKQKNTTALTLSTSRPVLLKAKVPGINVTVTARQPPPPNIFYGGGELTIRCFDAELIYDTPDVIDPLTGVLFSRPHWTNRAFFPTKAAALRDIRGYIRKTCKVCSCSPVGSLIAGNDAQRCRSDVAVRKCVYLFGCICYATLVQPTETAISVSEKDYQASLDQIPDTVKITNPDFRFFVNGKYLDFSRDSYQGGSTEHSYRRLAPGTKEPYYLEGPTRGGPFGGLKGLGGLGFSGGKVYKRSELESETHGNKPTKTIPVDAEDSEDAK
ncbi:hypothetical protein H072_173 [Dactylellina haptotyla CBS 200.50]|uniref:Uncharacterized protein n=1 Tax=Dactylellina haptotyla (strain CBS 200.50) TaxID=1284197 RepID=S8AXQ0_DACHA|nr:hypothetical protein H072_173 [Dactylellina haptotyla CBS 200.50]